MRDLASHDDMMGPDAVWLSPEQCRDVNRWWTVARSVTNVAHDLKNALQVISGNVEMLTLRPDLDPATARRLKTIATQAARLVETMEPLVVYARESPAVPSQVDLRALAGVALSFRSVSLGRGGVATSVASSSKDPLAVTIDQPAALQLLLNLVLRAEQEVYGRTEASIVVTVERRGGLAVVEMTARARGERPARPRESAIASELAGKAIAELARAHHAVLRVEEAPDRMVLALSVPIDPAAAQAADSEPPSR